MPRSPRGGTRTRSPHGGPAKNPDLHGNVPDKAPVALILIDVINDLEFPDGERLARQALPMARRLAALKARARKARIPAIYVNDNFGKWQSDQTRLLEHSLATQNRGRPMGTVLKADIRASEEIDLEELKRRPDEE